MGGTPILSPPITSTPKASLSSCGPHTSPHIVFYKNNTSRAHPGYRASPCGSFVSIRKKASFSLGNPSLPGSHSALSWYYDCDGGGEGALSASSLGLNFSIWAAGTKMSYLQGPDSVIQEGQGFFFEGDGSAG